MGAGNQRVGRGAAANHCTGRSHCGRARRGSSVRTGPWLSMRSSWWTTCMHACGEASDAAHFAQLLEVIRGETAEGYHSDRRTNLRSTCSAHRQARSCNPWAATGGGDLSCSAPLGSCRYREVAVLRRECSRGCGKPVCHIPRSAAAASCTTPATCASSSLGAWTTGGRLCNLKTGPSWLQPCNGAMVIARLPVQAANDNTCRRHSATSI